MPERHRVIPAAFVIVYDVDGDGQQILLHRRTGTGYRDGWYDAASGHIERDETPNEAAARELREETGLVAKPEDLELFHVVSNDRETEDRPYLYLVFRIKLQHCVGTFGIQEPDKCDDMQLFPAAALPERTVPQVIQAIEHISDAGVTFSRIIPN